MKQRLARLGQLEKIRDRAVQQAVREVRRAERDLAQAQDALTQAHARVEACRQAELSARQEWLNPGGGGGTLGAELQASLAKLELLKSYTEEARAAVPPAESALVTAEVTLAAAREKLAETQRGLRKVQELRTLTAREWVVENEILGEMEIAELTESAARPAVPSGLSGRSK